MGLLGAGGAAAATNAPAAAGLDLPALKQLALRDNPGLRAAQERVLAARERVRESASAYAPVIRAGAGYTRNEDQPDTSSGLREMLRSHNLDLPAEDTRNVYNVGVSATWVLYDGLLRKFELMSSRERYLSEEQSRQDASRVLLLAVSTAYGAAMLSAGQLEIATRQTALLKELGDEAVQRARVGKGTEIEVMNFKLRLNTSAANERVAAADHRVNLLVLSALLGRDGGEPLALAYPEGDPPAAVGALEAMVAAARRDRPDVQALRDLQRAAEAEEAGARAAFRPTLTAGGSYGLSSHEDYGFSQDDHSSSMYVALDWTLFSGGSSWFALQQASYRATAAAFDLDDAVQGVDRDVRAAAERLEQAVGLLPLRRQNVDLAVRIRDLTRQRYDSGLETLTRLNQVLNDEIAAEDELITSRVNVLLAQETLQAATGAILQTVGAPPPAP